MAEENGKPLVELLMNFHSAARTTWLTAIGFALALPCVASAADTGADLAAKLRDKESGSTLVRIRMQVGNADNQGLQIQIKSRVGQSANDIVYQILFPKARKGESVLLHRAGHKFTGTWFRPPDVLKQIGATEMNQSLFGSDLSYEDVIDSPFGWNQQAIVGTEVVDGTPCQILQSKPGKEHSSSYASVKSWVDPRRVVPLRIEKYDTAGKIVRRINATRILLDGGDSLPADLKVYGPGGSTTQVTGSRLKRGLSYADSEFTPEGIKQLNAPSE